MTALTSGKEQYLHLFDQCERQENGAARPFLENLRRAGIERFRELGFPTPRHEDWKFTNLTPLLQVPFVLAGPAAIDRGALPPLLAPDSLRLVFANGRFVPEASHLVGMGQSIVVGNLASLPDSQLTRLQPFLGNVADTRTLGFTALNTAFVRDGAVVSIPDGVELKQPVELIHVSTHGKSPGASHPRSLIVAGKNARLTVVERFLPAQEDAVYFTNAVCEIVVQDGAAIDHYKVLQEGGRAFHVANTQVAVHRAGKFSTHYLALAGGWIRNDVRVRFDDEGAEATVNGLYLGQSKQQVDNHTVIDHAQAHCTSHELYKGILADQAHGVFNGKIFVRPGAQKTDAKQTNKVLLLSESATINTKPQLEIFADDVKCTHGATIGQLDDEAIFYLRSRGLGLAQARNLLTFAFANDVIGRIGIEALRDELAKLLLLPPA